jgi:hypothetical protein
MPTSTRALVLAAGVLCVLVAGAGNRSLFDVPVGEAGATYRVAVETVDWVKECR